MLFEFKFGQQVTSQRASSLLSFSSDHRTEATGTAGRRHRSQRLPRRPTVHVPATLSTIAHLLPLPGETKAHLLCFKPPWPSLGAPQALHPTSNTCASNPKRSLSNPPRCLASGSPEWRKKGSLPSSRNPPRRREYPSRPSPRLFLPRRCSPIRDDAPRPRSSLPHAPCAMRQVAGVVHCRHHRRTRCSGHRRWTPTGGTSSPSHFDYGGCRSRPVSAAQRPTASALAASGEPSRTPLFSV